MGGQKHKETIIADKPSPRSDSFLSDSEVEATLASYMIPADQGPYNAYGHRWVESAFIGRTFVIYRAGRNKQDAERLATIDVEDINLDTEGVCLTLKNRGSTDRIEVRHVPTRLFRYAVFVQVPPKTVLKWNAQRGDNGRPARWLLSVGLLIKTRNNAEFHNKDNIYCCTLAEFEQRFPAQK